MRRRDVSFGTMNAALLDQVLDEPDLHEYRRRINERWADEQRRRAEYRDWLDEDKRAEWINGEIVMHTPERWAHGVPIDLINDLLRTWLRGKKLGATASNKLIEFARNDYIPDLCYWPADVVAEFEGTTAVFPAPALVVEVLSRSTRGNDRGIKLQDYAAGGVREYWIVDADHLTLEQYVLAGTRFELRGTFRFDEGGDVECVAVAGLRFPVAAVFDEAANAAALAAMR